VKESKSKKSEGVSLVALIIIVILMLAVTVNIVYILKIRKQEVIVNKEMTSDQKFAEYVKNLKAIMLKYNEEKEYREYFIEGKDANDVTYSITLSGNGILKLNKKEVAKNVIGFNVTYYGNGGYKAIYFIKDDGTVASTSIDETKYLSNGNIKTTDVKGLKNIVSIIGGKAGTHGYPAACYAYAIDIDGNMFEI